MDLACNRKRHSGYFVIIRDFPEHFPARVEYDVLTVPGCHLLELESGGTTSAGPRQSA